MAVWTDAKDEKKPLAEILAAAVKDMTNQQLKTFKAELERKLPEVITQAAQAAQDKKDKPK